jgi:DNA-binding PadR family transcriptional regulator
MGEEVSGLGRFSDPALFILVSLAGGEKHGYAMMEDIEATCGVRLGPGTLYGALSRLERRGLVEPLVSEERRKPYRITAAGASALEARLRRIEGFARTGLGRLATA